VFSFFEDFFPFFIRKEKVELFSPSVVNLTKFSNLWKIFKFQKNSNFFFKF
jgi:hypothetical protein